MMLTPLAAFAGHDGELHRDQNITFIPDIRRVPDRALQAEMKRADVWKNFVRNNGQWEARFNEENGMPHRAFGFPIRTTGNIPAERAMNFLRTSGFNIPFDQLSKPIVNLHGKHDLVDYTQVYKGIEVWNSRVMVQMLRSGEVVCFGLDVYPNLSVNTTPTISEEQAKRIAQADLDDKVTSVSAGPLRIVVVPFKGKPQYKLVREITVETVDIHGMPSRFFTFVDAHAGKVIYRDNQIRNINKNVVITAPVSVNAFTHPMVPTPLPNLWAEPTPSSPVFSDTTGLFTFNINAATPYTFRLKGRYSSVFVAGSATRTPFFSQTINATAGTDTFNFYGRGSGADTAGYEAVNSYYHVNIVHDYMKTFYPTFTAMDNSLPTNILLTTGTCNAFYNGSSINFYASGGGCPSFALIADVIYHEYGHGINDKYYQRGNKNFSNGALGEGYADTWALGITVDPVLARGSSTGNLNSFIRRYDLAPKVYPADIVGEVHADGEIIAGAWWDVGTNWGNRRQQMELYAETFNAYPNAPNGQEGELYTDVLLAALLADDNDGNLMNGTPHAAAITAGFARHGITLMTSVDVVHTPVDFATPSTPITLSADINYVGSNTTFNWTNYVDAPLAIYNVVGTSNWDTARMVVSTNPSVYTANIPGKPKGSIIRYYVTLRDIFGNLTGALPNGFNNLPYYTLVGCTQRQIDDFDASQTPGWLIGSQPGDNATTGQWIVDEPVPSYINTNDPTTVVQTGNDFTPSGSICLVTANAPNSTAAPGTADVDGGATTARSGAFNMSSYRNPIITYRRWYSNSQGANPGNDPFVIEISNNGTNWVTVEKTYQTDRNWRKNAIRVTDYVQLSNTVYLRFRASDSTLASGTNNGQSLVEAAIDDITIFEEAATSTKDLESTIESMKVYPNPATTATTLEVKLNVSQHIQVRLSNSLGQAIQFRDLGLQGAGSLRLDLNTAGLPAGIYMVEVLTGSGIRTQRLVIQ